MLLDEALQAQTKEFLKLLEAPVCFTLSVDDSTASQEVERFVQEVCALDENLSYTYGKLDYTPAFRLHKSGCEEIYVDFAGIPLGHEYNSFILALLQISGRAPKIEAYQKEQIQALTEPLNFVTYVSLSCHNCPDVVQALNIMSVLNANIHHTMVDGALFKEEVEALNVMAVPAVFLNGELWSNGKASLDELLKKLGAHSTSHLQKYTEKVYDMLVIGAGPAGVTAAIYASRKGLNVALVGDRIGGQVNETLGIENLIGTPYIEGPQLAQQLQQHMSAYPIDFLQGEKVARIQEGELFTVQLESQVTLSAKTVIVATGARWRNLNVPGEDTFRTKGVAYCPHCDAPLFAGKNVAVAGGGNSGMEAAIDLANVAAHVTVFEFMDHVKADQVLQKRASEQGNIDIITNAAITEIYGTDKMEGLRYMNRVSNEQESIVLDGIFVQIGLVPNTDFVQELVECNERKEIIVDQNGSTNIPGLFAAGDCTDQTYKQIIISMGSGATAALSAFDYFIRH